MDHLQAEVATINIIDFQSKTEIPKLMILKFS